MSGEHKGLPFSALHRAKFETGLQADRPDTPEGLGDQYLSTDSVTASPNDSRVLSVCVSAGVWLPLYVDWLNVFPSAGGAVVFKGVRIFRSTDQTITDDTVTDVLWDTDELDNDSWHDEGGSQANVVLPAALVCDIETVLKLDVSTPTTWTIRILQNGTPIPQESYDIDTTEASAAGLSYYLFALTTLHYFGTGSDVIKLQVYQNSGVDLDVLTDSWLVVTERK